jgi:hypothetical protein
MLVTCRCFGVPRTADQRWEQLISDLMTFPSECGSCDASGCRWDPVMGCLVAFDGSTSMEVEEGMLGDMMAAGVLYQKTTDFGERGISVNMGAIVWDTSFCLEQGSRDPLVHVDKKAPQQSGKLSLMMLLAARGWQSGLGDDSFYTLGGALRCNLSARRPKLYFAALALAEAILHKMSSLASLPVLHHGMPESYYRVLIHLRTADDFVKLESMLSSASNIASLPDKSFAALLQLGDDEEGKQPEAEADQPEPPEPPPLAPLLPGLPPELSDQLLLHRNIAAVLRGIPASSVDLRSAASATVDGRELSVHFDNMSHSSGKQRCYIRCPSPHHRACFKYTVVERFADQGAASAWLMAWAAYARDKPASFTKHHHGQYVPDAAAVSAIRPLVQEDV